MTIAHNFARQCTFYYRWKTKFWHSSSIGHPDTSELQLLKYSLINVAYFQHLSGIIWRLLVIYALFITLNTTFHMDTVKKVVFNSRDQSDANPCQMTYGYWMYYYFYLMSSLFHPIIYFWLSTNFRSLSLSYVKTLKFWWSVPEYSSIVIISIYRWQHINCFRLLYY